MFFSDGIVAQKGTATAYKLQEIIDLALRSGIVLNAAGTRGVDVYMDLMFKTPVAEDDKLEEAVDRVPGASAKALVRDNTWKTLVHEDERWDQERPLIQMASDTGGMFHSGNFMDKGLHDIARSVAGRIEEFRQRYLICYIPRGAPNSGWHTVKVRVNQHNYKITHRPGYKQQFGGRHQFHTLPSIGADRSDKAYR